MNTCSSFKFFRSLSSLKGLFLFIWLLTLNRAVKAQPVIGQQQDAIIRYPHTTAIAPTAQQVLIIDFLTEKVVLAKNAYERMAPSSMTKIMTAYLIEEKIQKGEVTFDSQFIVSKKAWSMGGSKTFMPLGEMVKLKDILYGIIVQSGNDACIVAAEGLCGSEQKFVDKMNQKAQEIGMKHTHFMNATGWPEGGHYSTAYDLALLGKVLIKNHPEFYPIYGEKYFTFGKNQKGIAIVQGNRNTLLYKDLGCDGIKTGHTEAGGFGLVASFIDNGRRYIMVINGISSMKKRAEEALMLLHWVKQNFTTKKYYSKDEVTGEVDVWLGVETKLKTIAAEDVAVMVTRFAAHKVEMKIDLSAPIPAPIKAGDIVGKIRIITDYETKKINLLAKESVAKAGFLQRIGMHFKAFVQKLF